jgi:hypothetical protein
VADLMAGHGSARPDDQAHHENRDVTRRTYINRYGGGFAMGGRDKVRPALTVGGDAEGVTSARVGGPAGDASLSKEWRYGDPNSSSAVVRRGPEPYKTPTPGWR